jgi:hypothetical protein
VWQSTRRLSAHGERQVELAVNPSLRLDRPGGTVPLNARSAVVITLECNILVREVEAVVGADAVVDRLAGIVRVREVKHGLVHVQAELVAGKLESDAGTGILDMSVRLICKVERGDARIGPRSRIHRGRA